MNSRVRVSVVLISCICVVWLLGCETENSEQSSITVSPSFSKIDQGESLVLRASGWTDYTWSLSNPSIGVLSATKGDQTTYTAVQAGDSESETTQIIRVSTPQQVSSDDDSQESTHVLRAEARIVHMP